MAGIVIPVFFSGDVISSIMVTFAIIGLLYIPLFFLGYLDEKFSLNLGNGRWLFWIIIILGIVALWLVQPFLIALLLLMGILVVLLPSEKEGARQARKKQVVTVAILCVGILLFILVVFFIASEVSGSLSKSVETARIRQSTTDSPRFAIQIVNASGVISKVLGTSKIENITDPHQYVTDGPWSVTITLTDEGADAYRNAILDSGAMEDPIEHPLSILSDTKTQLSQPISRDLAERLRQGPVREIEIVTGDGKNGWAIAMNIVYAFRESREYPY